MNELVTKSVDLLEYIKEYRKFAIECVRVVCLEIKPYEVEYRSILSVKEAAKEIFNFNEFISDMLKNLPKNDEIYKYISDMHIEINPDDKYQMVYTYKNL